MQNTPARFALSLLAALAMPSAVNAQVVFSANATTSFGNPTGPTCGLLESNEPVSGVCNIGGPFGFCSWIHGTSTSRASRGLLVATGHNNHGPTCNITSRAYTGCRQALVTFHGPAGASTVNTRMRMRLRGFLGGHANEAEPWSINLEVGVSATFITAYNAGANVGFGRTNTGDYFETWTTNTLGVSLGLFDTILMTQEVEVPLDVPIPVEMRVSTLTNTFGGDLSGDRIVADTIVSALSFVHGGQAFDLPPGFTAESADLNIVGNVWTDPRPQVVNQPDPITACLGGEAGFQISVEGTAPFTYRWRKDGAPLVNGPTANGSLIAGAETDTLLISNTSEADQGEYDCVVVNAEDTTTSVPASLRVCSANCDCSTIVPILNVNDFACFINKFAGGDPLANCDESTTPPVLNVNDFICFQQKFAAGCP